MFLLISKMMRVLASRWNQHTKRTSSSSSSRNVPQRRKRATAAERGGMHRVRGGKDVSEAEDFPLCSPQLLRGDSNKQTFS